MQHKYAGSGGLVSLRCSGVAIGDSLASAALKSPTNAGLSWAEGLTWLVDHSLTPQRSSKHTFQEYYQPTFFWVGRGGIYV